MGCEKMPSKAEFDVIVVGAGPAGITAAYSLAKAGMRVAVFERGEYPGAKNMFGGVLYGRILEQVIPNFWQAAPIERYITRYAFTFLQPEASFSMEFREPSFKEPPYNGCTVLRSRFDRWYAGRAEEAGALVVTNTTVDEPLMDGGKVIGVRVRRERGEVHGRVVIAADGVNSLLAQRAGLGPKLVPEYLSVGVKEVLGLPEKTIEDKFSLGSNEGIAQLFIGSGTQGLQGGAFLYTNRQSISIGLAVQIASLKSSQLSLWRMLEDFKQHPVVRNITRDAIPREYSAHLIPEGGRRMMPKLYTDGMLVAGDAAGFVYSTGLNLEGVNFAIGSGLAAAKAVTEAFSKGDFSRRTLAAYEEELKNSFVLQDLDTHQGAVDFLSHTKLYNDYPRIVTEIWRRLLTVDGSPRKNLWPMIRDSLKENQISLWQVAGEAWRGGKSL